MLLDRQLQAMEYKTVEAVGPCQHGRDLATSKCLLDRPKLIWLGGGTYYNSPRQIDTGRCGRGGVKPLLAINHHHFPTLLL